MFIYVRKRAEELIAILDLPTWRLVSNTPPQSAEEMALRTHHGRLLRELGSRLLDEGTKLAPRDAEPHKGFHGGPQAGTRERQSKRRRYGKRNP